jgi:hypothetical protein
MKREPDHNIHLGIVVQNNDPEMRGRVKIYTPLIAPTVKGASADDKGLNSNTDKFFNFLGANNQTSSEIVDNLKNIKDILPWAEFAGPISGGNASGRYNATTEEGTTSDANTWDATGIVDGFRPAQNYTAYNETPDAFTETGGHQNRFVNEYAHEYTPSNYSGLARGLFSIPNVGSHVFVFFLGGNITRPVYFASAYGQDDIKRIFTLSQDVKDGSNVDYPDAYENINKSKLDAAAKTFRSKTVLNSNKHTIELIDTDLREIMKLTHYSGSFKEFNNYATIELAVKNDQKKVLGDQFLTVGRNQSQYIKSHKELIVGGDHYVTVGESPTSVVQKILDIHRQIHSFKLLFDVKRAEFDEQPPNNLSPLQKRVGKFKPCPVCGGIPYDPFDSAYVSSIGNYATIDNFWKEAPKFIKESCHNAPTEGDVLDVEPIDEEDAPVIYFTTPCYSFLKVGEVPSPESLCLPIKHPFEGEVGYYRGNRCACCNNELIVAPTPGESPSTEGGRWDKEDLKQPDGMMDQFILANTPELISLERELGEGGDEIIDISMNKVETVGLVMNDLPSFRVDPIGKLKIDGCWVSAQGTYNNYQPSPHVEYVDVADIPGGDYNLTCMNKYKLLAGSKGVNIQTSGPIDIYGSILNMTGEQINIGSKNEVVIDGGERLTLRAKKITALPFEHNAFVVEGQHHVTRNMIVQGGAMIEGEVALMHLTAPIEWQETAPALYDLLPDPGCFLTAIVETETGMATPGIYPIRISLPRHTHWFKNAPMNLLQHPEAVRESMISKGINSRNILAAANTASNPTSNCNEDTWGQIEEDFLQAAHNQAYVQYTQQVGNNNEVMPLDSVFVVSKLCIENTTIDEVQTEFRVSYTWSFNKKSGSVSVIGVTNENGVITGNITAS